MEQEQTYKWVQERLRQLHAGTLSGSDLERLREIALEDPFVADALEGYAAHPDDSHAESLQYLESKIVSVRRERRRWLIPNLTITAIAASLLIIIATYAVMTRMDHQSEEKTFVFVSPDSLPSHVSSSEGVAMAQPPSPDSNPEAPPSISSSDAIVVANEAPKSKSKISGAEHVPSAAPDASADKEAAPEEVPAGKAAAAAPAATAWPEDLIAFLKSNSRYPIADNEAESTKRVTFEFYIGDNGKPIRVESMQISAWDNYKAEALRLIKMSSGWTCADGMYPCKMKYTVLFK